MKKTWYKEGIVYQIYPRSFKDSNGDGIGDLRGIIEKVPYLKELGISIIWLCPVYQSPNDDNGYDISDYRQIHPDFGTMADMEELIDVLHQANIKLIMDLVVNHTSDEHEWFKKSVDKVAGYSDFYHWKKEKSNWSSFFGGEAWTYHPIRKEYYLHLFSKKQPDLNWDNPLVREEIKSVLRFWLDKGIDGFRCDVINLIGKEDGLPKGKFALVLRGREHYLNHRKCHQYLQEINRDVLNKYDCFTVGETAFVSPQTARLYQNEEKRELDMLFQFDHMAADNYFVKWFPKKFRPINLKKPLAKWQNELNGYGWNTLYLENHDQVRSVSRFGDTEMRNQSAKMLATMLFFQQGTPFIYQGQEIGMTNADFKALNEYKDIESLNIYQIARKKLKYSHKKTMRLLSMASRDNARTPMQWDDSEDGGFGSLHPWIGLNKNHVSINVKANLNEEDSILNYYKKIIMLRKQYPVIVYGDYQDIHKNHPRLYAYKRVLGDETLLILCNFSKKQMMLPKDIDLEGYQVILSNTVSTERLLTPYEARVYHKK